jgi:hypothetical protein
MPRMLFSLWCLQALLTTATAEELLDSRQFQGNLLQAGIGRSGTTLLFNALKAAFPKATVAKTHNSARACDLKRMNKDELHIIPIRHPFDILISTTTFEYNKVDAASLKMVMNNRIFASFWDEVCMYCKPVECDGRTLRIYYKRFLNDFDYLFDSFEILTKTRIDSSIRKDFKEHFHVEKMFNESRRPSNVKDSRLKNKEPGVRNKNTMIHYDHVSEHKGATDWTSMLKPNEIELLRSYKCVAQIEREYGPWEGLENKSLPVCVPSLRGAGMGCRRL